MARPPAAQPPHRVTPPRLIAAALLALLGYSEFLASSSWFDPGSLPGWLAMPIVMIGFFGVILLWSFLGNAVLSIVVPLLIRRTWRWPAWIALAVAAPFWIVTYRLSPKPW